MTAFTKLAEAGQSVSAIAARFGASERIVEQRIRLGNAAPELLDAYRADEIGLEVLKAFTVTTDRERQLAVWEQVSGQGYRSAAGPALPAARGSAPDGPRCPRSRGGADRPPPILPRRRPLLASRRATPRRSAARTAPCWACTPSPECAPNAGGTHPGAGRRRAGGAPGRRPSASLQPGRLKLPPSGTYKTRILPSRHPEIASSIRGFPRFCTPDVYILHSTHPRAASALRPRSPAVVTSGSSTRSDAPLASSSCTGFNTSRVERPSRSRRCTTGSSPSRRNSRMACSSVRPSREAPMPVSARMTSQPASPSLAFWIATTARAADALRPLSGCGLPARSCTSLTFSHGPARSLDGPDRVLFGAKFLQFALRRPPKQAPYRWPVGKESDTMSSDRCCRRNVPCRE